jgi:hypothetical protein
MNYTYIKHALKEENVMKAVALRRQPSMIISLIILSILFLMIGPIAHAASKATYTHLAKGQVYVPPKPRPGCA